MTTTRTGRDMEQKSEDSLEGLPPWPGELGVCAVADMFIVIGILNVYGIFYVEFLEEFKSTKAETAWLGSLTLGLLKLFAPACSMLIHRVGRRVTMVTGCLICSASLFTSSFASSTFILFFSFSLLYGVGSCLVNTTAMTVPTAYFNRHRGIATGFVCAGSSVGTLCLAPLTQLMITWSGWRRTWIVYSGLLMLLALLNLLVKPLSLEQRKPRLNLSKPGLLRTLVEDLKLWKDRVFVLWTVAICFVTFGYYVPSIHLISYARGVGVGAQDSSYLLMGMGASTAVGRLVSGKLVQYGFLHRLHLHQMTMILTSVGYMTLPLLTTLPLLGVYVVCIGLVDGCYVVLLPILTCSMVEDRNAVLAWGFLAGTTAVTFTMGPPIAGLLVDKTGSYDVAFRVAGAPVLVGALLLFFMPWAQVTAHRSTLLQVLSCEDEDEEEEEQAIQATFRSKPRGKRADPQSLHQVAQFIDTHFKDRGQEVMTPLSHSWVGNTETPVSPRSPRVRFSSLPLQISSDQYQEAQMQIEEVKTRSKGETREQTDIVSECPGSAASLEDNSPYDLSDCLTPLCLNSGSTLEPPSHPKEETLLRVVMISRSTDKVHREGDISAGTQKAVEGFIVLASPDHVTPPGQADFVLDDPGATSPSPVSLTPSLHRASAPSLHRASAPSCSLATSSSSPSSSHLPPRVDPMDLETRSSSGAAAGPSTPPLHLQDEDPQVQLSPLALAGTPAGGEGSRPKGRAKSLRKGVLAPLKNLAVHQPEGAASVPSDGDRLSLDSVLGPCERNESNVLRLVFDQD